MFATQKLTYKHYFSLQNKAFAIWLRLLLAILSIISLVFPNKSSANELFESAEISIVIPNSFELVPNKSALVLLKHRSKEFPTFNAVLVSGPWPHSELRIEEQAEKILDDYRLVGIKDAKIENTSSEVISGYSLVSVVLSYSTKSRDLSSKVLIIPFRDRHIFLTSIYNRSDKALETAELSEILKGLEFKIKPLSNSQDSAFSAYSFIIILALLVTILGASLLIKKKIFSA